MILKMQFCIGIILSIYSVTPYLVYTSIKQIMRRMLSAMSHVVL